MQRRLVIAVTTILVIVEVLAAAHLSAAHLPNFVDMMRGLHGR